MEKDFQLPMIAFLNWFEIKGAQEHGDHNVNLPTFRLHDIFTSAATWPPIVMKVTTLY